MGLLGGLMVEEDSGPETRPERAMRMGVGLVSALLVVLGAVVLVGWWLHNDALTMVLPGHVTMKANTALGFILAGLGLGGTLSETPAAQRWTRVCGVLVAALGALAGLEYLFNVNFKIDELLFRDPLQRPFPGRMARVTATSFLFSGTALLLMGRRGWTRWVALGSVVLVLSTSLASVIGRLYGIPVLYGAPGTGGDISMALHTGAGFVLLGLGLLVADRESPVARVLASREAGGWVARRGLPLALLGPILLGWLYLRPGLDVGGPRFSMALLTATLMAAGAGAIIGVAQALNWEERQRAKAQTALLQSEKLAVVGRLASSIAHEINNPLEAVTNLLYLAEMDSAGMEPVQSYVRQAQAELGRVTHIVVQTLRFHRQSSQATECRIIEVIDQVMLLYHGRINGAGLSVTRCDQGDATAMCREGEVRQVVANLVGNAVDAMHGGGRLLVRTGTARGRRGIAGVTITVADTGPGIPLEMRRKLFEPFQTTKGDTGSGLGLWVSKEIVDRHKGSVRVRSSVRGTVFWVWLPVDGG